MKYLITATLVAVSLTACTPNLAPCPSEDYDGQTACYWDAQARGNHQGQSFVWDGHTIHYTTSK